MKVDAKVFVKYAGRDQQHWNLLAGVSVLHPIIGSGVIKFIEIKGNDISIYFCQESSKTGDCRCFSDQFLDRIDEVDLPDQVAQQVLAAANQSIAIPQLNGQPAQITRAATRPQVQRAEPPRLAALFSIGDDVCLKTSPQRRGKISHVRWIPGSGYHYEIFYSEFDHPNVQQEMLQLWKSSEVWGTLNDLLCDLALLKLNKPQSDSLYALYSSRTKFEVYQFKPAVKFLGNPDQRLLIADEVGLGKTIEAGIIYLELQARLGLDQVLIVCPSSLKQKWQDEMKSRFDEEFEIMDTKRVRKFFDDYQQHGDALRLRGIVSLETIRLKAIAEKFSDIRLDMVVIDEAHHCRNTSTLANAVASTLVENADAALLLTATPLQMGKEDLFNLLNILSPGEFDNFNAFIDRLEPNQFINRAASYLATGNTVSALTELRKVERTTERNRFTGNPYYQEVVKLLSADYLSPQEMVTAQRRMIELNTLSTIFTRTRKRDINEKSPIRTAQTLTVHFTEEEKAFYNKVVNEARDDFESRHLSGVGSGWITIMKERQVASCISAVMRRYQREQQHLPAPLEDLTFQQDYSFSENEQDSDWENDFDGNNGVTTIQESINQNKKLIRVVPIKLNTDTKFDVFWESLKTVLEEDQNTKVIVFSFFRDTIDYLESKLREKKVNVKAIHGGYHVLDRHKIIEEFRESKNIRVLISSDVGSEGLDFQFCDTLFNYDLPWNPMKVEQRIGRIDRFGQLSDRVRIFNLVIEDSIESRILMRLYDRIEIFKQSIGDIEEILGEQIRELTQAVFSRYLTPAEEIKRAEEASTLVLKRKQEMEEFEKNKLQFLGQEAIFSTTIEKTIESGRFVSDVEIQALVDAYLREKFPLSKLEKDKDDGTFFIRANDDFITEIKSYIFRCCKNDPSSQQFLKNVRAGKELPLTFSSELAYQRKLLEFITPRHPLARSAREWWSSCSLGLNRISRLRLISEAIQPGEYAFFIYSIDSKGIEQNSRLVPVVVSKRNGDVYTELSKQMLRLAQTSSTSLPDSIGICDESELKEFEDSAFQYITKERDLLFIDLANSNTAILNARLSAVEQSYIAKRRCVQGKIDKVNDERIMRMYSSQLRNMEAKHKAKVDSIKEKEKVEVTFTQLLRGYIEVVNHA